MNSTKHRRKIVTQSITQSQNNKEHRIHNRENSPYQVSETMRQVLQKVKLNKPSTIPLSPYIV
jgi:hypothetical protein